MHVADDADHRDPRLFIELAQVAALEPFADRILPWPEAVRHRLVDHRDGRGVLPVLRSVQPAAQQWHAQRAEVITQNRIHPDLRLLTRARRHALDDDAAGREVLRERQRPHRADRPDSRYRGGPLEHALVQRAHPRELGVGTAGRHARGQQVPGVEPRRSRREPHEAVHQQTRPRQQHHRHRDLRDDERPLQASAPAARARARPLAQRRLQVHARCAQRRHQPEQQHAQRRDRQRERESARIDRDRIAPRQRLRSQQQHEASPGQRDRQPGRRAQQCEHRALRQ